MPQTTSDGELNGALDAATPIPEVDGGPPRIGKASGEPERRCIATMERRAQSQMIRFVLGPDNQVVPDIAARLPGRGAWVTASRDGLQQAVKRGAFARAFKAQAKTGPDLAGQTEDLLVKGILSMIGMAKRAGDLTLGFEQVREAVRSARPACLMAAANASEDQRNKVLALVRGLYGPQPGESPKDTRLPPVIACFSDEELGMALGRERVVHACLKQGRIAHAWMGELARLAGFRRVWLPGWQPASVPGTGDSGQDIEDSKAQNSGGDPPDSRA
jgi:predicted RNA-binding protein YlxR (DUF448 family)